MEDLNGKGVAFLWELHEDRLKHLENERIDIATALTEQTVILKELKEDVNEKLIYLGNSMLDMKSSLSHSLDKLENKVIEEDKRLTIVEVGAQETTKKTDWWKTTWQGALVAAGGVIFGVLMEYLRNHWK